jgi:cyclophilin family peptidyl-prolyl cis-trans isomerase
MRPRPLLRLSCRASLLASLIVAALAGCRSEGGDEGANAIDESALLRPSDSALAAPAPDSFRVTFQTTHGNFTALARRAWAPHGVDRFYYLVKHGYYNNTYFFRVVENFVAQFGMSGNPAIGDAWDKRQIPDDSVRHSNTRGTISFASSGPNSRTVQLFINLTDNRQLDNLGAGFPPIGEIVDGVATIDSLYNGYGEGAPGGLGPRQDMIASQGNDYLKRFFPKLDMIRSATVAQEWR